MGENYLNFSYKGRLEMDLDTIEKILNIIALSLGIIGSIGSGLYVLWQWGGVESTKKVRSVAGKVIGVMGWTLGLIMGILIVSWFGIEGDNLGAFVVLISNFLGVVIGSYISDMVEPES